MTTVLVAILVSALSTASCPGTPVFLARMRVTLESSSEDILQSGSVLRPGDAIAGAGVRNATNLTKKSLLTGKLTRLPVRSQVPTGSDSLVAPTNWGATSSSAAVVFSGTFSGPAPWTLNLANKTHAYALNSVVIQLIPNIGKSLSNGSHATFDGDKTIAVSEPGLLVLLGMGFLGLAREIRHKNQPQTSGLITRGSHLLQNLDN